MTEKKSCSTCVYENGQKCKILHEKISFGCYAWADEKEAQKRDKAIVNYSGCARGNVPTSTDRKLSKELIAQRTETRRENEKLRGGKTVKEILDEHFNWLYLQDLTDEEIAKRLYIDKHRVNDYRRSKHLPAGNKKDRSTGMKTVASY